jgi:hypothetical protein
MIVTSTGMPRDATWLQSSQLANRFNIIAAAKTQSYFRLGVLRNLMTSLAILMDRAEYL